MIKYLLCAVGGALVGLMLYELGVPNPFPPIVAGIVACWIAVEVRHE